MSSCKRKKSHVSPNPTEEQDSGARSPSPWDDDCLFQIDTFYKRGKHPHRPSDDHQPFILEYLVHPTLIWKSLHKFGSFHSLNDYLTQKPFTVSGHEYRLNDFILLQRALPPHKNSNSPEQQPPPTNCVAQILEIRAKDEANAYLRIYWLLEPSDLPCGKQSYHSERELIASNRMDIVRPSSILSPTSVSRWNEEKEDTPPKGFYFRQTFNVIGEQLSLPKEHCVCRSPQNPDVPPMKCPSSECGLLIHQVCILKAKLAEPNDNNNDDMRTTPQSAVSDPTGALGSSNRKGKGKGKEEKSATRAFGPKFNVRFGFGSHGAQLGKKVLLCEDLREGSRRTWEVPVQCLKCRTEIFS
ncbi:MAG: hypothetical protein Q9167_002838 [Letrouitia subvulpina]